MPKEKGGQALPCFESYYQAAQLKTLWSLCNPANKSRWEDTECLTIDTHVPLQAIIHDKKISGHVNEKMNPWLGLPLKIWFEIIAKNKITEQSKVLRWIAHDSNFIPNTGDSGHKYIFGAFQ